VVHAATPNPARDRVRVRLPREERDPQGTGVVTAGDEQWTASAGSIAAASAFSRHGWENTGSETLKLVGFFGANVAINTFDEPISPFGVPAFVTPIME
jgi:hypothetical protein